MCSLRCSLTECVFVLECVLLLECVLVGERGTGEACWQHDLQARWLNARSADVCLGLYCCSQAGLFFLIFFIYFFRLYHMLSVFDLHCLEFGRRVQFLVLYCSADVCPGWLESTVRKQVSRVRCSVFFCVDIYFQKNSGNMYPHRNSGNMFTHNYTHVCTQIYTPYQVRRVWCRSPEILEIYAHTNIHTRHTCTRNTINTHAHATP